jgi:hypothetical protein
MSGKTIVEELCFDSGIIRIVEHKFSLYYSDDEQEDEYDEDTGKNKTKVDICNYEILLNTSAIEFYCMDCKKSCSSLCYCKDRDWYSSFLRIGCAISCENFKYCKEIYKKIVDNIETVCDLNCVNLDKWIRDNIKEHGEWELNIY